MHFLFSTSLGDVMKVAKVDIKKCIEQAVQSELDKQGFDFSGEYKEFIVCGDQKLQQVELNNEEYFIWVSLEDSLTKSAVYPTAIDAISEKIVDGESVVGFDGLADFCKWFIESYSV